MTLNDHWGYNSHDKNWKSVTTIIHNLVDCASKGGNYLLNVGPTAEGLIPAESVERLAKVGAWMKANGESIYGTSASPFKSLAWGRCTRKGSRLYLHVFNRPADGILLVPMSSTLAERRLLAAPATPLPLAASGEGVRITLPATLPDADDTVIVAEAQGEVQPIVTAIRQAADGSLTLNATDADVAGGLQLEGDPPNLGFWTSADGQASWNLQIDRPGQLHGDAGLCPGPQQPGERVPRGPGRPVADDPARRHEGLARLHPREGRRPEGREGASHSLHHAGEAARHRAHEPAIGHVETDHELGTGAGSRAPFALAFSTAGPVVGQFQEAGQGDFEAGKQGRGIDLVFLSTLPRGRGCRGSCGRSA